MPNAKTLTAIREVALGIRVEKTLASLADADIFIVVGTILIKLLYGQVTGVGDGGATTIKLQAEDNSIDMCAATTVTSDAVDEIYVLTGDKAVILNGTGSTPVKTIGSLLAAAGGLNPMIFGKAGNTDAIQLVQTGDDATHAVKWCLYYLPLENGAYVTPA